MLLSEFLQAEKKTMSQDNKFEQNNLFCDILNAGDNVDNQEDYGFGGSFFKIAPTVIDDYTIKKLMNMQLEYLILQRII